VGSAAADSEGAWSVSTSVLSDGTHSITARATDEAGNTGAASANLSVVIDTAPPVVDAGADQNVDEGTLVSLSGAFTDTPSNNGTPTRNWHLVNSTNGQTFADGNGQSFSFTPNNNGSYTLRFTVTDSAGNSGSDDVIVAVNNVAPTVTLTGPASASEGQTLHYTFTASDPGLDTFSVAASSGGIVGTVSNLVFNSGTGAGSFDVTFSNGPATSTVSVQLQDSDGALSNVSSVDVAVDNVAPTVNLTGPTGAYGGQTQHYVFTTGDPGADVLSVVVASGGIVGTVSNLVFNSGAGTGSFDVTFNTGPAVSTVSIQVQDSDGALSNLSTIDVSVTAVPPTVQSVQVDDGSAQRSRVTELTVTFSTQVSFAGGAEQAFTLVRVSDGAVVTFTANISTNGSGQTVVRLTNFGGAATQFGSLADGRYTLTALGDQISAGGSLLDGDGNGSPGGDFTFGDTQGLFRFFGDINGDRHVDIADFGQLSISIFNPANYNAAFDFNGDGHIDIADFGQFSIRIFTVLP
jgi:K319L-like, PKD domain/Bacterial Ig-like domain/Dockerin type I domain